MAGWFGLIAAILVSGGIWQYRYDYRALRAGVYLNLDAIADLKEGQLVAWRHERLADAQLNATGEIRTYLLARPSKTSDDGPLLDRLGAVAGAYSYDSAFVVTPDGVPLVSTGPLDRPLAPETQALIATAIRENRAVMGDFFFCRSCGGIRLDVAAPILDDAGQAIAVLALRTDPERYLYPLIQTWPTPSPTAETLLVRREGDSVVFLNALRHAKGAPLSLEFALSRTDVPAVQAALGTKGLFEGTDYRGEHVLADLRTIPDSSWSLIAKTDSEEIWADARKHGFGIAVVVALAVLTTMATGALLWSRLQQSAIEQELEAERARQAAREEIRSTLYSIADGVITTDTGGRITRMNPASSLLTGCAEREALGRPLGEVFRIVDEHTRAPTDPPVTNVLRGTPPDVHEHRSLLLARGGRELPIAATAAPIRDQSGTLIGVVLVFRDETEERAAQRDLQERQAALEQSQRVANLGHYTFDIRSRTWTSSQMLDRIFGIDASYEHTEDGWLALTHPSQRAEVSGDFDRAIREHGHFNREYRIIRADDHAVRWLHALGTVELDADGRPAKLFGTVQDITDRVVLEDQLRQAQKMESVGRLAGGVAHDFNNMLGIMLGNAEIALRQVGQDHPARVSLDQILEAGRRSASLTRQLLAFARKQEAEPRVLDLNETVAAMLTMLRRLIGEDIELVWRPGAGLWPVAIDPAQVDQILANLAVNARDAIRGTGLVTIETANVVVDAANCDEHADVEPGTYVRLTVSDTGSGIEASILEHIFEPFFTTKGLGRGTGLGLATVYGIVRQNNGFIEADSEPGKGTLFRIYLPQAKTAVQAVGRIDQDEPPRGTETVLVVEDEMGLLVLSTRLLTRLGYEVLTASVPADAIEIVQRGARVDLLITDVVLPGMNGRELYRILQEKRPHLGVLYMSGYTADVIAERGIVDTGVSFLQKPFTEFTLAQKVRATLDQANGTPRVELDR